MEKTGQLDWGLLWFDNSDKPRNQKIIDAATRYRQKHGRRPNLCYVHPSEMEGMCGMVDGVTIVADAATLKHHYWIGVAKEKDEEAAKTANS